MAKKLSVLDLLYPGGVPADDAPASRLPKDLQPRKGGKRDLGVKVSRDTSSISKPNEGLVDAGYRLLNRAAPGSYIGDSVRSVAEPVIGASEAWNAGSRAVQRATGGDPYAGNPDQQSDDALTLGMWGAAEPAMKGIGFAAKGAARLLPKGVRTAASDLAVRAKDYLTEARPLYDISREGGFTNIARSDVAPRLAPAALETSSLHGLRAIAHDPAQSDALAIANRASMAAHGRPYDVNASMPISSLARQGGIARAFDEAVEGSPAYKHALFERYGEMMPQVVEQARAQNLDQLTEAAYTQLGKEGAQQFHQLPVTMRYHDGAGEYRSPQAMMQDVHGRGNLNVFSGGEPHEFLSRIDPNTGLSQNEMFRAVHDYMGHVVPGSMFGAPGEEVAYAAHARTLSPLAQLALLSETRGQNSWVNYGGANAHLIDQMNRIKKDLTGYNYAKRYLEQYGPGDRWYDATKAALEQMPDPAAARAQLHALGGQFTYAPQKAVLLPPEYLDPLSAGGTPDWLRQIIQPRAPSNDVRGVHFSKAPDLTATDPAMYGTGAKSGERPMVLREGLPNRTYFYNGAPGTVAPEESVGRVGKHVYEARLHNLYDLQRDPENLLAISRAHNLDDYKSKLPELLAMNAKTEGGSTLPDLERLIRDYGYSGYLSDMGRQRAAAVFDPVAGLTPIAPGAQGYASGGRVS